MKESVPPMCYCTYTNVAYMHDISICHLLVSALLPLQPSLKAQRDEWASGVRRHVYEVNSRRCRRTPMYGRDLVCTVRGLGYAEVSSN